MEAWNRVVIFVSGTTSDPTTETQCNSNAASAVCQSFRQAVNTFSYWVFLPGEACPDAINSGMKDHGTGTWLLQSAQLKGLMLVAKAENNLERASQET